MESLSTGASEALRAFRQQLSSEPTAVDATWARIEATRTAGEAGPIVARYDAGRQAITRRWPVGLAVAAAAVALLGLGFVVGRGSTLFSEAAVDSGEQSLYGAGGQEPREAAVEVSRRAAEPVEPEPTVEPEPEPELEPEPTVEPEPEPEPEPAPARRRAKPQPSSATDLAAEIDLLRRAKQALGRSAWAEALEVLKAHHRRFPRGQMATDRRALQLEARCGLGGAKDRAKAQRFVEQHPGSPYAARLRKACGEAP